MSITTLWQGKAAHILHGILPLFILLAIALAFGIAVSGCATAGTSETSSANGGADSATAGSIGDSKLNWTLATTQGIPFHPESLAYGNGKFITGGRAGNGIYEMAYSTDGITWTMITDAATRNQENTLITFCGGRFFASGWPGNIITSTDGINWTTVHSNTEINGITYGNGKWVFVTDGGQIKYSSDSVTWTETRNRPSGLKFTGIAYGNGKFIAVAMGGRIVHSTDGMTWTEVTNSPLARPQHAGSFLYFIEGKFFATGNRDLKYSMAYSTDGITWTTVEQDIFAGENVLNIAYGGGKFVANGWGNTMAYSTDGITWPALDTSAFDFDRINGIAYGNGRFVAVGRYGEIDWERIKETIVGVIVYSNKQE